MPLKIEKKQRYEVRAQPVGCSARTDTLEPPHKEAQEFLFQFMIRDCAPRIVIEEPVADSEVTTAKVDVAFSVESRARLLDLSVSVNDSKLVQESAALVAQLNPGKEVPTPGQGPAFRTRVALRPGPNTIRIDATDRASGSGSATVVVDYAPVRKH